MEKQMKNKFLKLSLVMLICALFVFAFNYFFFHFVTDSGITLTWQPEAGKPFVAEMISTLGVLFLFGSAASLMTALIIFDDKE